MFTIKRTLSTISSSAFLRQHYSKLEKSVHKLLLSRRIAPLVTTNIINFYSTETKLKESRKESDTLCRETQTKIGDVKINFTQVGEGPHVLLGLPGTFGTIETDFEPLISRLDHRQFKIVAWDPPGYGKSREPNTVRKLTPQTDKEDAQLAAQLMEQLGHQRYSILGWSRGAVVAVHLYLTHPQKVNRLCFWGAPAYSDDQGLMAAELLTKLKLPPKITDLYGEETGRKMVEEVKRFVIRSHQTGSFQMKPLVQQVKAPTLIIHGAKDINCPPDHGRVYHEGIANSKFEIWKNNSHFLHLESPDQLVKRITKFMLE